MGFFGIDNAKKVEEQRKAYVPSGVPVSRLHQQECKLCTLNNNPYRGECPKMTPKGLKQARFYVLTSAPDQKASWPISGRIEDLIMDAMPRIARDDVRFANVIGCYPGAGSPIRTKYVKAEDNEIIPTIAIPTPLQIECCRPSLIRDIERNKPDAIFGFGGVPLRWAANETHPMKWSGRRIPVKIGTHECWYYPFADPYSLIEVRRWADHEHEYETTMARHLREAVEEVNERWRDPKIHTEEMIRKNVRWITGHGGQADVRAIRDHLEDAVKDRINGLDYETNAKRPYNKGSKILTAAVAGSYETLAWAMDHRGAGWTRYERDEVDDIFRHYLYTKGPVKIAHQLPFEMEWSAFFYGKEVLRASEWADSLSQAYILNQTQGMLALEVLTMQHFGFNIKEISPVDRKRLDEFPVVEVLKYNGIDSKYHRLLYLKQEPMITDQGLDEVYAHQIARIPTLTLTALQGVPVDQPTVREFRDDHEKKLKVVEDEIRRDQYVIEFRRKYGHEFNEASGDDIKKFFKDHGFGHLDSTNEVSMNLVKHPLVPHIMRRRKLMKVLGTYIKAVCEEYVDRNGETVPRSPHLYDDALLHPIIGTTKVETWRTSSEEPNVQNWPKRSENVIVRRQIKAPPGHKVFAFDYAGIQARNVAMESRDARLVQSFWDRYDIHTDFMEKMIDCYPKFIKEGMSAWNDPKKRDKLAKHYRHIAKNKFVFPTFFGAQAKRVATDCGVPIEAGEEMQDIFFGLFPDIKEWQLDTQADYKRHGYVTGLSGHRRYAPVSWNQLINSPIQADEALIVMTAMNALSEQDIQATFEIHDDLTFIFPDKHADRLCDTVIREMVKPRFDWINCPLVVELSVGDNWSDLEHVSNYENRGKHGDYVEFK